MRNKIQKTNGNYAIHVDENYTFISNEGYIIWDDANQMVTVIAPNKNTQEVPSKNHRINIFRFEYERICMMSVVPDTNKIDEWLGEFVTDNDTKKNIKHSVEVLSSDKYFTE